MQVSYCKLFNHNIQIKLFWKQAKNWTPQLLVCQQKQMIYKYWFVHWKTLLAFMLTIAHSEETAKKPFNEMYMLCVPVHNLNSIFTVNKCTVYVSLGLFHLWNLYIKLPNKHGYDNSAIK